MPWGCLHSSRLGGWPPSFPPSPHPPLTLPSLSRHTRPWLRGRMAAGHPTAPGNQARSSSPRKDPRDTKYIVHEFCCKTG